MTLIGTIRKGAKTAKWVGVALLVAGVLSLLVPFVTGLSVAIFVGILLLLSGFTQLLIVFKAGSFGEGVFLALLGALSFVAGGYMITRPATALGTLTLLLAGYFLASGVVEIVGAFGARPARGWGWLLFGGVVTVALGLMIWRQFPLSGVWAVGTLVGVRLFMSGWELIAIGGAARRVAGAVGDGEGG